MEMSTWLDNDKETLYWEEKFFHQHSKNHRVTRKKVDVEKQVMDKKREGFFSVLLDWGYKGRRGKEYMFNFGKLKCLMPSLCVNEPICPVCYLKSLRKKFEYLKPKKTNIQRRMYKI